MFEPRRRIRLRGLGETARAICTALLYDPPRVLDAHPAHARIDDGHELHADADGDETVLAVSRVAVGPFSDEDVAGIRAYGDIAKFEDAIRAAVAD